MRPSELLAAFLHVFLWSALSPILQWQMSVFILIKASTSSPPSLLRRAPHLLLPRQNESHEGRTYSTIYFQVHLPGSPLLLSLSDCDSGILWSPSHLIPPSQPSLSRPSTSPLLSVPSPSAFKYTSHYSISKANKQTKPLSSTG